MKKLTLFALILLWGGAGVFAQDIKFDVKFGEEIKDARRLTFGLMGYDDESIFVMKSRLKGLPIFSTQSFSIERLDKNYNVVQSEETVLKEKGKKLKFEFVFQTSDKLYMFTSFHNQKLMTKYLFVQSVDKKTLKRDKNIRKIAAVPYNRKYNSGWFDYEYSPDSSYILILAKTQNRKKDPEMFHLHVFDAGMELQWERTVRLNDTEERLFVINDYELDNWGNVFMMAREYEGRPRERRRGKANYKYTILSYHGPKTPPFEYKVSLGDKFLTDMEIQIDDLGNIICAGFFSNKGTWSIRGTYSLRVNGETGIVDRSSEKVFDIDFITQNMKPRKEKRIKKKEAKGKEVEMYEYDLRKLILRKDGSATLLAEQYYVREVLQSSQSANGVTTLTTRHYYYYNDIIVVNMGTDGKISWTTKVPKTQVSVDDHGYYSSFAFAEVGTDLYFIYNDNKKNYEGKYPEKVYNFQLSNSRGVVSVVKIDKDGKFSRQPLFANKEIETIIRPKLSLQFKSNELLLFGKRGKKSQFGRIKFG